MTEGCKAYSINPEADERRPFIPQTVRCRSAIREVIESESQNSQQLTRSNVAVLSRGPKRKWHFSWDFAEKICELIAHGRSLEAISKQVGFPSLWVIRQWRLRNPKFNEMLRVAREDRAEFYLNRIIKLATDCGCRDQEPLARLKFSFYKWAAQIRDPGTFGKTRS